MRRFLALWSACALSLIPATILTGFYGFRHVDLSYEAFFAIVLVPCFQALLLAATTSRRGAAAPFAALAQAWRQPIARSVIPLDLIVMLCGLLAAAFTLEPDSALRQLPLRWIGIKSLAAGYLLARASRRGSLHGMRAGDRVRLVACASMLAASALWTLAPVGFSLPDLAFTVLRPSTSTAGRWLISYSVLFGILVVAGLEAASAAGRQAPAAAALIETALGLAGLAVIVIVLNVFLKPSIPEPWLGVTTTLASLSASAFLIAALTAAGELA